MIKGVIFDMDGVISDTQKLHSQVEAEILNRCGVEISPEEITKKYAGVRTKDFFADLLEKQKNLYDVDVLLDEKRDKMKKLATISVEPILGSQKLIKMLYDNNFSLAVASASHFDYVETVLKSLNVWQYFSAVISGDMVKKGKPDPEIFLLAAKKINILPEYCLVFEDAINGMIAAKAAGMCCIGLVNSFQDDYPTKNLVLSLEHITLDYINSL